jgi:hypothetical protein
MRTVFYTTPEEKRQLLADAHDAGENLYHSDYLSDGTNRLTFADPQPDWVIYFRPALRTGMIYGADVDFDMDVLRAFHMDKIRVARNKELEAKDITFMRAVEAGDTDAQATIGTEKQVLRDIPATFDITTGVTTPDQLRGKWPTELPAR